MQQMMAVEARAVSFIGFSSLATSLPYARATAGRDAYRQLVDAVRSDDLDQARRSYDRVMRRLGGTAQEGDALARIGAALSEGDLGAANDALDGLERRALDVLQQAQAGSTAATLADAPEPPGGSGARIRITI